MVVRPMLNFRGISLLNVVSKNFTEIINERLVVWANMNNTLIEEQAGYKAGFYIQQLKNIWVKKVESFIVCSWIFLPPLIEFPCVVMV